MLKIDSKGQQTDVPVKIHLPVDMGDHWQCEYEIGWPENARNWKVSGIDSVQSLLIALQTIGVEIYISEAHKSGSLMWLAPGDGYGFPLSAEHRDLYEGSDRSFCP